ncbi:response regulator transcription factor [Fictibacillus sp. NRS-1165]|uniref:response regulator transcription factor n=1 Tax=Fictibacillus sp. NRS-1165 TaxID=3144463 RepID=UPI003D205028
MYKVMIVDDEPVIRYGLKASIPLENGMYELTGAFANGKEALEHFNEQCPDILITDIKMPIMDGLELARHALDIHPSLKIIFVSSYSDFDYVREGLKLGAVDYLLKPTLEPEDLIKLLEKCTRLIQQEHKIQQDLDEHRETQKGLHRKELEQELKQMLTSIEYRADPAKWNAAFGEGYIISYGRIHNKKELQEKFGYLYAGIKAEEVIDTFYRNFDRGSMFSLYNSDVVLVLPYSKEFESNLQHVKRKLEADTGITLYIGYQKGKVASHINTCFYQAKEACDTHFYQVSSESYPYASRFSNDESKTSYLDYLKEAVRESDGVKTEIVKEKWVAEWEKGNKSPDRVKREAGEMLSILFQRKVDIPILLQKMDELTHTETLEELKTLLNATIARWEIEHPVTFASITSHQQLMEKALHYIQQNYTSDLTLQKIADYSFISKNYFSLLFKKYMDQNFIDYVISLRVKKAEDLLANTSLKVYEVAHKSGFNDVKYFSKLFKKLTGLSPVDFREKAQK